MNTSTKFSILINEYLRNINRLVLKYLRAFSVGGFMVYIGIFITSFILVIAYYFFFEIRNKKLKESGQLPVEALFLQRVYKLDVEKIGRNKLLWQIALVNAFGISGILLLTNLVSTYILKFILDLELSVIYSIVSSYIIGTIYTKKGLVKKSKKDK